MGNAVRPDGWNNWKLPEREKTARYAEFKSTGPGAKPVDRVAWSKQLTQSEAEEITAAKVLAGFDNWTPVADDKTINSATDDFAVSPPPGSSQVAMSNLLEPRQCRRLTASSRSSTQP